MTITLITRYVEGNRKVATYKTLEGARKAAAKRFGKSPERGGDYVHDDYAVLYVEGATFDDIFPDSEEAKERAKLPNPARPFEVWVTHVYEEGPVISREVKDSAYATLWEAQQQANALDDQYVDGIRIEGITDAAKMELAEHRAALEAQLYMDREIARAKHADLYGDLDDTVPF